ncbi:hypothetical protein TIFTF001_033882, partial [Ficus carica]
MGNCISISCQTSSPDFVLSHCFKCTSKRTRYVSELGETLDALRTAFEELTDAKNDLMRRVNELHLQHKFGKKVSEKLAEVTDLQSKGVFEVVAERVLGAPTGEMPLEPTVGLETLFDK